MLFAPGLRRARPHPYDLVMTVAGAEIGLMLGTPDRGPAAALVSVRPPDQTSVAPSDYGYQAQSPKFERVQPYEDLSGGMGLKKQQAFRDGRYRYTLCGDLSVPGLWLKGPALNGAFSPASVDATSGVVKGLDAHGVTYSVNGRYVSVRASDTSWPVSKDTGSGKAAVDAGVVAPNDGSGKTYLMCAMGASEGVWHYDGSTWTQNASLLWTAGPVVTGDEVWVASGNTLKKCDLAADPTNAANWTAGDPLGEASQSITRLFVTAGGAVVAVKPDGCYTLEADGTVRRLWPFFTFAPDSSNGKGLGHWLDDVWLPFRQGFYRISAGLQLDAEKDPAVLMPGNDAPVRGRITACAGHDTHRLYCGIYNGTDSYLVQLVRYGGEYRWHGALSGAYANKRITAMWKSTVGASSGWARVYLGFSDGTLDWFQAPNDFNPAADSGYTFTTTNGSVYLPTADFTFASEYKALRAVTVESLNASATNYAQLSYKEASDGTYTAFGTSFTSAPRQYASFADNASGVLTDFLVTLVSTSTASCPQITGLAVHHQVRPALYQLYECWVLADDGLLNHYGVPLRYGRARIRTLVRQAAGSADTVTVILPDEDSKEMAVLDYEEQMVWDRRSRQWRSGLHLTMAEGTANSIYGTLDRLVEHTLDESAALTLDQLLTL